MSLASALVERACGRQRAAGRESVYTGRGSGQGPGVPPVRLWRGTTQQVCGLWPLSQSAEAPMIGAPLGAMIGGSGMVCGDHITWFKQGLITSPSALVLGLNGYGKSSLVRRVMTYHAYSGTHTMVLGDIKPDYVDLVRALGGQVIEIGRDGEGINPLDAGNVGDAAARLRAAGLDQAAADVLYQAHERRKTMLFSLIQISRGSAPTNLEELVVDEALRVMDIDSSRGQATLGDLLGIIRNAPASVMEVAMARGSRSRYQERTEDLEIALMALLRGRMGSIFSAPTTTPMRIDRSVVFDVSALEQANKDLQAAVLLSTWSYGFATIALSQSLADAGLLARRSYNLVMDELWRILGTSSGMVDRINSLTRLNRTVGCGQMMITHSLTDFTALASERDRAQARTFAEKANMLYLGAISDREIDALRGVKAFNDEEIATLMSWNASAAWDRWAKAPGPLPGLGKMMLKTSGAPGLAFQVRFAPDEEVLSDTSRRWGVNRGRVR
ncbi:ATP/GTP-binding protein [Actinomyces sp. zg296]|uniref:ATP/GTP-binding protein n=1 Tax=Actinomyces sp. zg296 TaxID=2609289 RepID=UPI001F176ECD|nr:ATP/GTP-binding protein [Actinomyces sp. zg296]